MEHKSFGVAELKATGPKNGGAFESIVSVFGNVDKGGDRMIPGAFKTTLQPPPEGRGYPAVVWSHLWGVAPIGSTEKAEEVTGYKTAKGDTVDGLYIAGALFVDDHQTAREVYTAMSRKGGDGLPVLRDFSFGYAATESLTKDDAAFDPVSKGHIRDLVAVDLYEVGPTLVGMNAEASLIDVKQLRTSSLEILLADLKAGARNSASDADMLKQIHDLTTELGVKCAKSSGGRELKAGIGAALFTEMVEGKGYDDIDRYAIYLLTSMIDAGSQFIIGEEDQADVGRMRTLLLELAQMLADEIGEAEPDSGEANDTVELVGAMLDDLPTSGHKHSRARPPARQIEPARANELLLAFPR